MNKCSRCGSAKLRLTSSGFTNCLECGISKATTNVVFENYSQRNKHMRATHTIKEKKGIPVIGTEQDEKSEKSFGIKERSQVDINTFLESNWINFLEAFQAFLRICVLMMKEEMKTEGEAFEQEAKNIWFKYLEFWKNSKRRLVSFFTVPRKGLYKQADATYGKQKYNISLKEMMELENEALAEEEPGIIPSSKPSQKISAPSLEINYDMIFSQNIDEENPVNLMNLEIPKADSSKPERRNSRKKINQEERKAYYKEKGKKRIKTDNENEDFRLKKRKSSDLRLSRKRSSSFETEQEVPSLRKKVLPDNIGVLFEELHRNFGTMTERKLNSYVEDFFNIYFNKKNKDLMKKINSIKSNSKNLSKTFFQEEFKNLKIKDFKVVSNLTKRSLKDVLFIWELYRYQNRRNNPDPSFETGPDNMLELVQTLIANIDSFTEASCLKILKDRLLDTEKKLSNLIRRSQGDLEEVLAEPNKRDVVPLDYNLVLYIIYLALRGVGYGVLPQDVIELARSGKIPYMNGIQGFLPEIKNKEYLLKPINIPSASWIRACSFQLVQSLKLEFRANEEKFATNIIKRVVQDTYELPRALLKPCATLFKRLRSTLKLRVREQYDIDLVAINSVAIFLKMLYGFNGKPNLLLLKKEFKLISEFLSEADRNRLLDIFSYIDEIKSKPNTVRIHEKLPPLSQLLKRCLEKYDSKENNLNTYLMGEGDKKILLDYPDLESLKSSDIDHMMDCYLNFQEKNENGNYMEDMTNVLRTEYTPHSSSLRNTAPLIYIDALQEPSRALPQDHFQLKEELEKQLKEIEHQINYKPTHKLKLPLPCDSHLLETEFEAESGGDKELRIIYSVLVKMVSEDPDHLISVTTF